SCGKQIGDNEPNNTIEEASDAKFGEEFSLTIDPVGDVDWFKVNVQKQGYIQVQSANKVKGVQLEVSFAKYQEWDEKKAKRIRGWRPVPDALFVQEQGDYYLVLKDKWDDGASKEEFLIKIDFLDEFDPTEPNNSIQEAKLITFDEQFLAGIYPVGDKDWFKVNVPAQGYIEVVAKNIPKGINPEVRFAIFDEWSDPQVKIIRAWEEIPDACFVPDSGEYYIEMHDAWDDNAIAQAFDLKVSFIPEFDLFEPNNSVENARMIDLGSTHEIAIFPKGDKDYFKFIAPDDKVKVSAKDYKGVQPEIKLLSESPDNEGKYITELKWTKLPVEIDVEKEKEYILVIHDAWDDNASKKTFQLKVE
ncbi:MAG TPA: hypothetical protein VK982_08925, partial [Bacteroidales bacterium]|nr:hypothetical protein [Bacteroidales bacterium]